MTVLDLKSILTTIPILSLELCATIWSLPPWGHLTPLTAVELNPQKILPASIFYTKLPQKITCQRWWHPSSKYIPCPWWRKCPLGPSRGFLGSGWSILNSLQHFSFCQNCFKLLLNIVLGFAGIFIQFSIVYQWHLVNCVDHSQLLCYHSESRNSSR